nr:hypothetical protein [Tanacetum cinerariifolium]
NLDDDVEKDIEDCSKNVTEKCRVVNNNMSNNVKGKILEDHFDGDHRNDTIEDNADVNPSTNVYLDVNQYTSIPEVIEDLSSLIFLYKPICQCLFDDKVSEPAFYRGVCVLCRFTII